MKPETLQALIAARAAKRPVVRVTDLRTGTDRILGVAELSAQDDLHAAAREALATDRAQTLETAEGEFFLNPYNPPLRMLILGAVHIAQPLAVQARLAGFAVTVVDPRTAFATPARFPGVTLDHRWPDEALPAFELDKRSAFIALTHDPKLDDPALELALRSPCFYIAALGSRKSQASRLGRLRARGHDETALARIHGPAGLAIGAKTPAEIAVSILAEAIEVLRLGVSSRVRT